VETKAVGKVTRLGTSPHGKQVAAPLPFNARAVVWFREESSCNHHCRTGWQRSHSSLPALKRVEARFELLTIKQGGQDEKREQHKGSPSAIIQTVFSRAVADDFIVPFAAPGGDSTRR